jgi:N-methylhydantoinase B
MYAISQEMAYAMLRSSRSPIWNEAKDFMTAVYGPDGRTLGQIEYIPLIGWGTQPCLEYIIEYYGDDIAPGDVILHNDVFTGSNQHADVGVYKPCFLGSELVGWTASKGHVADIGGSTLGGYNPSVTEVWQEALRIPPVKVVDRGVLRRDVWDLIFANVRLPLVAEDVRAAIGACAIGERRLLETIVDIGRERFERHVDHLLAMTEARLRTALRELANGRYTSETWVAAGDGSVRRWRIALAILVDDDEITFDFTGSDPQTPGYVNMPPAAVRGAVLLALLMLTGDLPHNAGLFAPVRFVLPEGSIVNPSFPAATVYGNQMVDHVFDAIMRALAPAAPERVTTGWCWELAGAWTGRQPDGTEPYVELGFFMEKGGGGATSRTDGYDGIGFVGCAGTLAAQDPEMLELQGPTFMECYEYWADSAGAGRQRGGYGIHTTIRLLGKDNTFIALGDGVAEERAAPFWGLDGGLPGASNRLTLHLPDGTSRNLGSKEMVAGLPTGTRIECWNGGGGGHGDPRERPRGLVRAELEDGLITSRVARETYGLESVDE